MARPKKEKTEATSVKPEPEAELAEETSSVIPVINAEEPEKVIPPPTVDPEAELAAAPAAPSAAKTAVEQWKPKTALGKKVKEGKIADLKHIFEQGLQILEPEIVDALLPGIETDLLLAGQAKGKFGGGQRRVFKQTQKKTMEGNKPKFSAYAVAGNKDGFVGIGKGKAKETVPAREKAFRNARLNLIMVRRGCGSWQCNCRKPHSVPYTVLGRCGSVRVKLIPAPKGKGLISEKECQKVLHLAGIKDVWMKSYGNTGTKVNLIKACMNALEELIITKIQPRHRESFGILDGQQGQYESAAPAQAEAEAE